VLPAEAVVRAVGRNPLPPIRPCAPCWSTSGSSRRSSPSWGRGRSRAPVPRSRSAPRRRGAN